MEERGEELSPTADDDHRPTVVRVDVTKKELATPFRIQYIEALKGTGPSFGSYCSAKVGRTPTQYAN